MWVWNCNWTFWIWKWRHFMYPSLATEDWGKSLEHIASSHRSEYVITSSIKCEGSNLRQPTYFKIYYNRSVTMLITTWKSIRMSHQFGSSQIKRMNTKILDGTATSATDNLQRRFTIILVQHKMLNWLALEETLTVSGLFLFPEFQCWFVWRADFLVQNVDCR